ncbi:glutamate--cysteine ligase [Actinomadura graeca]|uniref:Putative glutamate--cysteine ligase 2 n=1 Tax=Actinomadura graeca TaxID=2750812 RepID=A0ABX8QN52_9ACTN|nr:glutamate--cysteine ligase [Actinomadura graeca]QXJ19796.1 glutamate--cysteine ligase [Actinomadura graeca]
MDGAAVGAGAAVSGVSLGVEEEFLLVDGVSGECVPAAEAVLARAGGHRWEGSGGSFQDELLASQVEAATGVCGDLAGLRAQVRFARARLAEAARACGLRLVSSGTPVMDGAAPPPARGGRFTRIAALYRGLIEDYQACGCHVHVGVADRETAVAVVNHLRPWLGVLLALSANSPFDHGRDSGYASRRLVEVSRFPGAGTPPWAASAAEYDRRVAMLVESGVLVDASMTFWLARPSPRWPTVEVRAADAAATADEAVLQAALVRALVRVALADLAAGREAPPVDAQLCAAGLWSAARYGMDGALVDPSAGRAVPAWRLLEGLLARLAPALEETGDLAEVSALVEGVRLAGTGARRQRRAARRGRRSLVEALARQTESGTLPVPAPPAPPGAGFAAPAAGPAGHGLWDGLRDGVWGARERVSRPDARLSTEET